MSNLESKKDDVLKFVEKDGLGPELEARIWVSHASTKRYT